MIQHQLTMWKTEYAVYYVSVLIIASVSDVTISADASKYSGDVRTRDSARYNLLASDYGQFDEPLSDSE